MDREEFREMRRDYFLFHESAIKIEKSFSPEQKTNLYCKNCGKKLSYAKDQHGFALTHSLYEKNCCTFPDIELIKPKKFKEGEF